ncbi:MAG: response regulator [Candidatus Hydrogenedentes bacterium]|nr:response regulator [Candidatus Hydrogenedentota bacterium]
MADTAPESPDIGAIRREALALAGIGLLRLNTDGTIAFIDKPGMRVLGLEPSAPSAAALLGQRVSDLIPGLFPEEGLAARVREDTCSPCHETSFVTQAGEVRWLQHECYLVTDPASGDRQIQLLLRDITMRKAEEQQERLRHGAVDAPFSAIGTANLDGVMTYANPALLRMWGYADSSEVIGRRAATFWRDEAAAQEVLEALWRERHWSGRLTGLRKDGSCFDVHLSAMTAADSDANPLCLMVTCVDVSEHERLENELRRRIELERMIVRISTVLVSQMSHDLNASVRFALEELGRAAHADHCFLVFESRDRRRVGSGYWWRGDGSFTSPVPIEGIQIARLEWIVRRLALGEEVAIADIDRLPKEAAYERELFARSGLGSGLFVPVRYEDRNTGVIGLGTIRHGAAWDEQTLSSVRIAGEILANVVHRRLAEEEVLRRAEFERMVNAISTQFIGMPPDEIDGEITHALGTIGRFARIDRCYISLLATERGMVTGSYEWCAEGVKSELTVLRGVVVRDRYPWASQRLGAGEPLVLERLSDLPPEASAERALMEMQSVKSLLNVPITVSRRLIGIFGLESITREIVWPDDMVVMATIMGQVFGNAIVRKQAEEERQHLEDQVRHAQKLESLGVLAGGIAHDFNNVLMGIIGNAGLAMMELPPESPVCDCIIHIERAAQHAAELTNQLLAYSGKRAFSLKPVNLTELTRDMMHLLETVISKRAFLTTRLSAELPPIQGDASQLRQVVMNLITNASDAVEEAGGNIRIATGVMYADQAYLTATYLQDDLEEGRYVFIEVADTGCGMDQQTVSRMFDPFFSTKFTGRGLGLAAVLGIVRAHKGAIKVDSAPNQGTQFRVIFPCQELQAEAARPQPPEREAPATEGLVLVVDDEPTIRRVVRLTLERVGYRVITANDGREGVKEFENHRDEIQCIILDMTMPVMDGKETYYALRKMHPSVPIILSSGYSQADARIRLEELGTITFIQKPYTTTTLIETVRKAVRTP